MKRKVVSIEISSNDFSYIVAMYDDVITNLLYVPESIAPRAKDIIDLMLSNIPVNQNDVICYDGNGFGAAIGDAFADFLYKENLKPLSHKNHRGIPLLLEEAKSKLLDYALNSDPIYLDKGEFKRLHQEVHNLIYKQNEDRVTLQQKDKNIGKTRAVCFLNALYTISQN